MLATLGKPNFYFLFETSSYKNWNLLYRLTEESKNFQQTRLLAKELYLEFQIWISRNGRSTDTVVGIPITLSVYQGKSLREEKKSHEYVRPRVNFKNSHLILRLW